MPNRFRYWLALKILGDLGLITNTDFYSAILPSNQKCLVVNCNFSGKFKEDDFDYSAFYRALSRKSMSIEVQ